MIHIVSRFGVPASTSWFNDLSTMHFSLHIFTYVDKAKPLERSHPEVQAGIFDS